MAKIRMDQTKGIVRQLTDSAVSLLAAPGVLTYLTIQSEIARVQIGRKKPKTYVFHDYDSEKILLLALYQKGELRPDTLRFLEAAKAAGLYVLAVNTLKLKDPDEISHLVDTYIERPNFGRDFGSYKQGFSYLYSQGWDQRCERLFMANDSVYFSTRNLAAFVDDMITSEVEVLGSTENYEINYHLGSFCISMSQSIVSHPRFRKYWRKYRLTDVRPRVIRKGEMGLSKVLRSCASTERQMRALYDSARYADFLRGASDSEIDGVIRLVRKSSRTPAKLFSFNDQFEAVSEVHTVDPFEGSELKVESTSRNEVFRTKIYVDSFSSLKAAIVDSIKQTSTDELKGIRETVTANLLDNFRQHSQIHQNAILLLNMGLPIVKLDGVYRGLFDMTDVTRLMDQVDRKEAAELEALLISRPYGGEVLMGWKRAAFMRGLI